MFAFSQLGVLENRHFHWNGNFVNGSFKISPNLRILVLVLDQRSPLPDAGAHSFFVDRFPDSEKILSGLAAIWRAFSFPVLKC